MYGHPCRYGDKDLHLESRLRVGQAEIADHHDFLLNFAILLRTIADLSFFSSTNGAWKRTEGLSIDVLDASCQNQRTDVQGWNLRHSTAFGQMRRRSRQVKSPQSRKAYGQLPRSESHYLHPISSFLSSFSQTIDERKELGLHVVPPLWSPSSAIHSGAFDAHWYLLTLLEQDFDPVLSVSKSNHPEREDLPTYHDRRLYPLRLPT